MYSNGWRPTDLDGDGVVSLADYASINTHLGSTNHHHLDLDGDGGVDSDDEMYVIIDWVVFPGLADYSVYIPYLGTYRSIYTYGGGGGIPLNTIGHQGLSHDEETGLVYNRARYLHPQLGRFVQRDIEDYIDGMSLYTAYAPLWMWVDPYGNSAVAPPAAPPTAREVADKLWQELADDGLVGPNGKTTPKKPKTGGKAGAASSAFGLFLQLAATYDYAIGPTTQLRKATREVILELGRNGRLSSAEALLVANWAESLIPSNASAISERQRRAQEALRLAYEGVANSEARHEKWREQIQQVVKDKGHEGKQILYHYTSASSAQTIRNSGFASQSHATTEFHLLALRAYMRTGVKVKPPEVVMVFTNCRIIPGIGYRFRSIGTVKPNFGATPPVTGLAPDYQNQFRMSPAELNANWITSLPLETKPWISSNPPK